MNMKKYLVEDRPKLLCLTNDEYDMVIDILLGRDNAEEWHSEIMSLDVYDNDIQNNYQLRELEE